jgi:hypothetical protein
MGRSSRGVTLRPPSDWDIKIIAREFVGGKLDLQCDAVQPVSVNAKARILTIC